ncbi:MAG: N-6 DNA methylase, partial [Anaerolineaceae bacterium 4572_5.2]
KEKVQAETFIKLVLLYNYRVERIKQFTNVTMGASTKEADIIVYNDDTCTKPHIVIECKNETISELEFLQAINQASAYAYALSGTIKYIWITTKSKNEYFLIDKDNNIKQSIPDIPQFGINKIQKYKYVYGGREQNQEAKKDKIKQQFFELETISEKDLINRFKQAHNSLWEGGKLDPSEAFDELDKLIFCKIWDEKIPRQKGEPYNFQIFKEPLPKNATKEQLLDIENKQTNDLFNRIITLYNQGKKEDPEVFKDNIRLSPQKVKTVVTYLESINLNITDLDSKGKAFETFMGSYFRGDFGQFFTPRNIVKFIVNSLPIDYKDKVLDTSCGSGGFLLYALNKIRLKADVFYKKDEIKHYKYWHDFASNNLFGIEISEKIARTAKMNMILHEAGHTNVISSDGLLQDIEIQKNSGNKEFKYNHFDYIITNPPFGSNVKQSEKPYLENYILGHKNINWLDPSKNECRDNQSTEILFIEQCYNFLKVGGILAIVLPDGILTNSSLQYVRNNIENWFRIIAIVSMPQTAFSPTGAGVKSSVMFLRKWNIQTTDKYKLIKQTLQEQIKKESCLKRKNRVSARSIEQPYPRDAFSN